MDNRFLLVFGQLRFRRENEKLHLPQGAGRNCGARPPEQGQPEEVLPPAQQTLVDRMQTEQMRRRIRLAGGTVETGTLVNLNLFSRKADVIVSPQFSVFPQMRQEARPTTYSEVYQRQDQAEGAPRSLSRGIQTGEESEVRPGEM